MASENATDIVNKIFADDKADAIDAINNALGASSYELIQQKKLEFAQSWGFNPDDTAQAVADEITDNLPDASDTPTDVEIDGRLPEDPPEASIENDVNPEEPTDETDQ
jgi:hypothetical protein